MSILSDDTKEKIKELFDFIKEVRGYKNILNQIDNDSPTLLYLEYENKYNISKKDVEKIHHAMVIKPLVYNQKNVDNEVVSAPTQQEALIWLEEQHNIYISVNWD